MLLLTTLSGCSGLGNAPRVAAIQLPRDCENIAKPVALPTPVVKQDMLIIAAKNRQMVVKANARLNATRECQVRQREEYARGVK